MNANMSISKYYSLSDETEWIITARYSLFAPVYAVWLEVYVYLNEKVKEKRDEKIQICRLGIILFLLSCFSLFKDLFMQFMFVSLYLFFAP